MAVLVSKATGNFTAAGTWNQTSTAAELDSEAASTTTTTSYVYSATFVLEANEIDAVLVKLSTKTSGGTFSVQLYNNTTAAEVFAVTVDVADIAAASAAGDLGWYCFKGSAHTPNGTDAYKIGVLSSTNATVTVYRNSTSGNWSRHVRRTSTAAPGAGDVMHVIGELTGAGTGNSFTVTMDETATTDYGNSSTTLASLSVGIRGTLTWGVAASTNYNLKLSGLFVNYSGGTVNRGTIGTPLPSSSTDKLLFDCVSNVDFGWIRRNGSIVNVQGASITAVKVFMTADKVAGDTVIALTDTTGMVAGGELCFAPTGTTGSQFEKQTISTVDSATQVTLTAGLTYNHSGTSPTRAEVGYLTRNIQTFGVSSSIQAYVDNKATAVVDEDYAEYYWLGSATSNKRGIDVATTTGTCTYSYCAMHDFIVASSRGMGLSGASGSGVTIEHCIFYKCNNDTISIAATSGIPVFDNNWIIGSSNSNAVLLNSSDAGLTFTNNTFAGAGAGVAVDAIQFNENSGVLGTHSGNTFHSSSGSWSYAVDSGTISNMTIWANTAGTNGAFALGRVQVNSTGNALLVDTLTTTNCTIHCSVANADLSAFGRTIAPNILITNWVANQGITGLLFNAIVNVPLLLLENCTFGATTPLTRDINIVTAGFYTITRVYNCLFNGTTEVLNQSNLSQYASISSQKHDQTAGLHKIWKKYGTILIDTSISDASPSMRMTPNNASGKLESETFKAQVASGQTITPSVKIRESVVGDGTDYNGNRIRLIVKKNIAAGISADTVLATATVASEGAFETISGTTASVTDDCVLEFIVDCDGTTGWINADTFTATGYITDAFKYWFNGTPTQVLTTSVAGGGSFVYVS